MLRLSFPVMADMREKMKELVGSSVRRVFLLKFHRHIPGSQHVCVLLTLSNVTGEAGNALAENPVDLTCHGRIDHFMNSGRFSALRPDKLSE